MPREDKEIFYSQGLGMLSPDCSTLLEVFEEIDNKNTSNGKCENYVLFRKYPVPEHDSWYPKWFQQPHFPDSDFGLEYEPV